MNVFDAIKGTILNVPKDITSGIKSLTTRDVTHDNNGDSGEDEYFLEQQGINYDAGAELLNKFQNEWSELHQKSEENSKKAKTADGLVAELFLYLERQNDAVNQFLMEISSLPQLLTDLQSVTQKIDDLEGQFELLESDLVVLEDVCEEQDLRKNRQHHQYQLETYRQRRTAELEQAKVHLAKQHAFKVQKYEQHLQKSLRERQQAFEANFREEVQHYKKYGHVSPIIQRKPSELDSTEASIDAFVPDADSTALDDFLKNDTIQDESQEITSSASTKEQNSETAESVVEGQLDGAVKSEYTDESIPANTCPPQDSENPTCDHPSSGDNLTEGVDQNCTETKCDKSDC